MVCATKLLVSYLKKIDIKVRLLKGALM